MLLHQIKCFVEEIVVSSNELQIVVFSHQATPEGIVAFSD